MPPGAPPPTRYPEHIPTQFWECLFRQTEVQRAPPYLPESVPPELRGVIRRPQEEQDPPTNCSFCCFCCFLFAVSFCCSCCELRGRDRGVAGWPVGSRRLVRGRTRSSGGRCGAGGFGGRWGRQYGPIRSRLAAPAGNATARDFPASRLRSRKNQTAWLENLGESLIPFGLNKKLQVLHSRSVSRVRFCVLFQASLTPEENTLQYVRTCILYIYSAQCTCTCSCTRTICVHEYT